MKTIFETGKSKISLSIVAKGERIRQQGIILPLLGFQTYDRPKGHHKVEILIGWIIWFATITIEADYDKAGA